MRSSASAPSSALVTRYVVGQQAAYVLAHVGVVVDDEDPWRVGRPGRPRRPRRRRPRAPAQRLGQVPGAVPNDVRQFVDDAVGHLVGRQVRAAVGEPHAERAADARLALDARPRRRAGAASSATSASPMPDPSCERSVGAADPVEALEQPAPARRPGCRRRCR